ncbi:MAG: DUF3466 family protein [Phycisphaerales bacterium]|nr:DUF3466 family protein [Phycisphaerales bacterium]
MRRTSIDVLRIMLLVGGVCSAGTAIPAAHAAPIFGGPFYDSVTNTGYSNQTLPANPGSSAGDGLGVGYAQRSSGTTNLGRRAFRWDASGAVTELGNLGTNAAGATSTTAFAVNATGTAVGTADKLSGADYLGQHAVRWDASGDAATELGHIGTDTSGVTTTAAYGVNSAGAAVGDASKYSGDTYLGKRAVRWGASGTAATELGNLGTDASGFTNSAAITVNTAGTAAGSADKYSGGVNLGTRAVRWNASGTAATELGNLGTDATGRTNSQARAINTAGTAVGNANKYSGGATLGSRAVRWDASGTAATELGNLGTNASGSTTAFAYAINDAGTSVGSAEKYVAGASVGSRAVRWDASGAATELGNLGTSAAGSTNSVAFAINNSGIAVGVAGRYPLGTYVGDSAVYWGLDGEAVDLNTFLSPADRLLWTLFRANGISDTNWVTGVGRFDPDGLGPRGAYDRAFLIQIPAPSAAGLLALGGLLASRRRR